MKTRAAWFGIVFLLVCVATIWGFYGIGRGAEVAPTPADPLGGPMVSALPSKEAAARRFAAAGEESFSLNGKNRTGEIATFFGKAARGVVLDVDPDVLLQVSDLAEDECEVAARAAMVLSNPARQELLEVVLARWAQFAPRDAAEFALENAGSHGIRGSLAAVFQSWGRSDPAGGLDWYREQRESDRFSSSANSAIGHLFNAWGQSDIVAAGAAAEEFAGGSSVPWRGLGGLVNMDATREGVLAAAMALSSEAERTKALSHVVREWATKDPTSSAAWLDDNNIRDPETERAVTQRFENLDPQGNAEWLLGRAAEAERDKVLSKALYAWSRTDIESAAAWLEKLGPTAGSIGVIAQGYATVGELDKAIAWAGRAAEEERDATIAEALANAVSHGRDIDISGHLGAGTMSAEEMAAEVEKRRKRIERF